jgi:hypothetical protein
MMHPFRKAVPVCVAAVLIPLLPGSAGASFMTWRPPAVQKVSATPSKSALVGKPVTIECVVGSAGELQLDTNSAQGKYLSMGRNPSWTVPVEIHVNGTSVGQFDDPGLSSSTATWKHQAVWTPLASEVGKPALIECVADPVKKFFYSTKTLSVPVLLKPIPRVRIKDQPPPTMKAIPHPIPPRTPMERR